MMVLWRGILKRIAFISDLEARVSTRQFEVSDPSKIDRIETVGRAFIAGYNAAIANSSLDELQEALEKTQAYSRGFAYEGASMDLRSSIS
jgi:hypothetical protein